MAIAGLLVMGESGHMDAVRARLADMQGVVGIEATEDACRMAVVLEKPADQVESAMSHMLALENVLTVDLAYLSYEDDLSENGHIPCPAHKPRKHHREQ